MIDLPHLRALVRAEAEGGGRRRLVIDLPHLRALVRADPPKPAPPPRTRPLVAEDLREQAILAAVREMGEEEMERLLLSGRYQWVWDAIHAQT